MDRKEFSELLVKHRQGAGLSKNEVMRRTGRSFEQIQRIEKATSNYSIDNIFLYLKVIQSCIVLRNNYGDDVYYLHNREEFALAFVGMRKLMGISQINAAEHLMVSRNVIAGIENNKLNTSIDKFIQCITGLGYNIDIVSEY